MQQGSGFVCFHISEYIHFLSHGEFRIIYGHIIQMLKHIRQFLQIQNSV